MKKLSDRISKLEAALATRSPKRAVLRYIIHGVSDAERRAQADAIAANIPTAFHVFRMIVQPGEIRAGA